MLLGNINGKVGIIGVDVREAYLNIITLAFLSLNSHTVGCGTPNVMAELLHTVDIEFEMSATIHIHHILASLLRCKHGLVLGREVFELNAWSEVMHTKRGNSKWCGIILRSNGLTLHTTIVPECSLHTFLTLEATLRGHQALHHLVIGQVAAGSIEQFLRLGLDTIENRNSMIWGSIIVTPHHRGIVSIGTNDGNLFLLIQGQDIVLVLQQHHRLTRHIQ